jgi:hypothetical protein
MRHYGINGIVTQRNPKKGAIAPMGEADDTLRRIPEIVEQQARLLAHQDAVNAQQRATNDYLVALQASQQATNAPYRPPMPSSWP